MESDEYGAKELAIQPNLSMHMTRQKGGVLNNDMCEELDQHHDNSENSLCLNISFHLSLEYFLNQWNVLMTKLFLFTEDRFAFIMLFPLEPIAFMVEP